MIIKEQRFHLLVKKVNENLERGYKCVRPPYKDGDMLCQEMYKPQKRRIQRNSEIVLPYSFPEVKLSRPYDTDAYTPRGEVFVRY